MEEDIKLEDSNLFLLGTDIEKNFRYKRAEGEPEWTKLKREPGVYVWRIEKFNVVPWPKEQYGSFYQGDSYLVLNIQKIDDELVYTAHMWIGKESTTDERGTAAYKIVELDDFLHGEAELVYEAQGEETSEFINLFPEINVMEGGIASGFRKLEKMEYKTRLLRVSGKGSKVQSYEVPLKYDSISSDDSYIIDTGLEIFAWRGKESSGFEKFACSQICQKIKSSRNGFKEFKIYDEGDPGILAMMEKYIEPNASEETKKRLVLRCSKKRRVEKPKKVLMKLSDVDGQLKYEEIPYAKENVTSDNTFLIDTGNKICIWCGKNSNANEKRLGLAFAANYVKEKKEVRNVPVLLIKEGTKKANLDKIFGK